MNPPKIDTRDKRQILDEILALARSYVPEWNPSASEPDAGYILSSIFAEQYADTLRRLNHMPYKHYLYFLNLLGVRVYPALSAGGYATVETTLSSPGVYISRGTRLYGVNHDYPDSRILYETEDDVFAVDNRLDVVFCTSGTNNIIVKPYDREQDDQRIFYLFDFHGYKNIQKYELAFSHEDIFNITHPTTLAIDILNRENPHVENKLAQKLSDPEKIRWYYQTPEGETAFDSARCVGNRVLITATAAIPQCQYNGVTGRWVLCRAQEYDGISDIQFTDLRVSSKAENLPPEIMRYNDLELAQTNLMPFGERFGVYDDFYIASEEVFTKKDAVITVDIDLTFLRREADTPDISREIDWKHILPAKAFDPVSYVDIEIERVVWEYWNGNGWARLFVNDEYEGMFFDGQDKRVKLTFLCPESIELAYMGAHANYWIRARVLKVTNAFRIHAYYVVPVIKRIHLSYEYKNENKRLQNMMYPEDLQYNRLTDFGKEEQFIYFRKNRIEPAVYLGFENSLSSGPIKLYIQKDGVDLPNTPALRFEYLSGGRWQKLKLLDETDRLRKSGLITFVLRDPPDRQVLYGEEKYWLRIINTDRRYDTYSDRSALPGIKAVYFNTVKISQRETQDWEMFRVAPNVPGSKVYLRESNASDAQVWVNEWAFLSDEEYRLLKENAETEEERDADGRIRSFWVRWTPVRDFYNSGPADRHFVSDVTDGSITFGNGKNGRLPASQTQAAEVRIRYRIVAGLAGNIDADALTGFAESVPYVARVYNPEPLLGGCDRETVTDAAARGTRVLHNRNRAVSALDMENMAMEADRNVVWVQCFSHINETGAHCPGHTVLAVLPRATNENADYFAGIERNIRAKLAACGSATLGASLPGGLLSVIEAQYIEIGVSIDVTVASYNDYQYVYHELEEKITAFLNPLSGNFDGNGFRIGCLPTREQIYNYVKTLDKIRYINNISLSAFHNIRGLRREIDYAHAQENLFAVPISGRHDVTIEVR